MLSSEVSEELINDLLDIGVEDILVNWHTKKL